MSTSTIQIPTFLKIAIKKMFFSHVEGEFEIRSEHVMAVIRHEEELRLEIPTDWVTYMHQVIVGGYKEKLKAVGYTDEDMDDMNKVELRDRVDMECPLVITEVRGTTTGKRVIEHVIAKKVA